MIAIIVQTVILIAVFFVIGAVIGALLRPLFGRGAVHEHEEFGAGTAIPATGDVHLERHDPAVVADPAVRTPASASIAGSARTQPNDAAFAPGDQTEPHRPTPPMPASTVQENATAAAALTSTAAASAPEGGAVQPPAKYATSPNTAAGADKSVLQPAGVDAVDALTGSEDVDDEPGTEPTTLLKAPREGRADKLTQVNGIGPVIEKKLNERGVFHFDQLAAMSDEELHWVNSQVGFRGRAQRENWKAQATHLAGGGQPIGRAEAQRGDIRSK